jgi:hypothetical protein
MTDNRDVELEVGQRVAFNLSGQIAKGEIVKIAPPRFNQKRSIHVSLIHRAAGHNAGHISKVTNEKNVLVLRDHEH